MNITHHKNGKIKTLVEEAPYHPGYEDVGFETKVVNNKPVAWAYIKHGEFWDAIHPDEHAQEEGSYDTPLYTHPHPDNLGLAESIIKQQELQIEALKKQCLAFQNASIDLAKKNAFLEDWKKTWSPYIKEAHGINTTILRKAQEK